MIAVNNLCVQTKFVADITKVALWKIIKNWTKLLTVSQASLLDGPSRFFPPQFR